jgi:4-hydroxyphenylacetate 3-monooxygenase
MPASYRDLVHPECGPLIERYVRSPGHTAEERIKLYKLVWDAVGSEFASRHEHYERFYHGAPYVYLPAALRMGEPEACEALADAALSGYELSDLLGDAGDDAPLPPLARPASA